MVPHIIKRMLIARDAACFTTSDMAVWYGVSRTAIHNWLNAGVKPLPSTQKRLEPPTVLLEKALFSPAMRGALPVPLGVTQYERKDYIEKVKDNAAKRFSSVNTAGRRGKVLGINKPRKGEARVR